MSTTALFSRLRQSLLGFTGTTAWIPDLRHRPSSCNSLSEMLSTNQQTALPIPDILRRAEDAIDFSSPQVVVKVGHAGTVSLVHEELVRRNSAFFNAALDVKCRDGRSRTIVLAEDDDHVFHIYMNWPYRNKICIARPSCTMNHDALDEAWANICMTYSLGDNLLDKFFKDALTDAVSVMFEECKTHLEYLHADWTMLYDMSELLDRDSGLCISARAQVRDDATGVLKHKSGMASPVLCKQLLDNSH